MNYNEYNRRFNGDCYVIVMFDTTEEYAYIPVYPDEIQDSLSASWSNSPIVGRSSPLAAYIGTNFRSVSFTLELHRELLKNNGIEDIIQLLDKSVYPKYTSQGLIPPITIFRFGKFYAKGFVNSVNRTWKKPLDADGKYLYTPISIDMNCFPNSVIGADDLGTSMNPFNNSTKLDPRRI